MVEQSPESEALKQLVITQKKLATEKVIADRLLYDKMVKHDTKIGNNPDLLALENKADESANELRNFVVNYIDTVSNKLLAVAASSFLDMNEEYNYLRVFSNNLMNYSINPKQKNDLKLELDKIRDAFKYIAPLKKIKGVDLNNKEVEVSSFENRYLFLNIWATWCLSSREQMPVISKVHAKYMNSEKIDFMNISIDESIDQWKDYILKNSLSPRTHLCQPNGNKAPVLKRFGVNYIPANFLLDKQGNIISSNLKYDQIALVIDSLLKNDN
jgi:thiol-disulfide isomerase/thioredoxin